MTTATQQQVPTGTWKIDPVHSSAAFSVAHNGISTFTAGVEDIDAVMTAGDDGLRIEGAARVETIAVDLPDLKGHLLSPEFFDAANHPEVRFEANDIQVDLNGQVGLHGDLEIRGTSLPIEARGELTGPAVGPDGSERVGLTLETTVDRRDYGMTWNMELPNGGDVLANDVTLSVRLELVREAN